jgi:hypothetical protein
MGLSRATDSARDATADPTPASAESAASAPAKPPTLGPIAGPPVMPAEPARTGPLGMRLHWWAIVVVGMTWLAWQSIPWKPGPGLDQSWTAGLSMAMNQGLTFGRDVIFTYGPLGFLTNVPWWFHTYGQLAFVYVLLLRLATVGAVFFGTRRSFGIVWSVVITVIAASLNGGAASRTEPAIVLIIALWAVGDGVTGRDSMIVAGALGAISGLQLLCKLSIGIDCALTATLVVLSLTDRRWKLAGICAGAGAVVLLGGWIAAGQPLGALGDYLKMGLQIVFGYGPAMSLYDPTSDWAYVPALLLLGVGVWAALRVTTDRLPRQRIGACLIWFVFWFFAFKEAFVRQNVVSIGYFFALLLLGLFAFRWQREQRAFVLAVASGLVVLTLACWNLTITTAINVTQSVGAAVHDVRDVVGSGLSADLAAGRAAIEKTDRLDAKSLQLLRGRTVSVFPTEIAVAWAYQLRWRPLPVLQSYSAYTPTLDHADASFLVSNRAPDRILLGPDNDIDTRVLAFDQGETTRAILCHYVDLYAGAKFAVLARTRNRCSAERLIATYEVGWGQTVPVPTPPDHSMILVKISGVQISGLERVQSLLWKPDARWIRLDGALHRLIEATAADGLPLRSSSGLDYDPPFSLIPESHFVSVIRGSRGHQRSSGRPITYRFYEQTFAPNP